MADSEAASKHEPTTDTALTNVSESAGKDGSRTDIAVTDDSKSVSKDESQTETAATNYSKVKCLPVGCHQIYSPSCRCPNSCTSTF